MRSLNLKDTFSWTRIWSCPLQKSLEGRVVHHISSTIIHPQFILGGIPGLFSLMVSFFTGIMGKKTSKSPKWFFTIAKLQSCLYVANLRKLGGCLGSQDSRLDSFKCTSHVLIEGSEFYTTRIVTSWCFFCVVFGIQLHCWNRNQCWKGVFFLYRDTPSLWNLGRFVHLSARRVKMRCWLKKLLVLMISTVGVLQWRLVMLFDP